MQGFTYEELTAALQSWPRKKTPEYVEDLDRIIQLAELDLIKKLNIELFDGIDTSAVLSIGSRQVTKPVNLLSTRELWLITAGTRTPLLKRAYSFCLNYAPNETTDTGTPLYFAELNDTTWYVVKTPTVAATVESHGVIRPESIVDADSTWLGDHAGELLFLASLCQSERWLKADDRFADMKSDYDEALQVWKLENRTLMRTGDYSPAAPAAVTTK